MTPSPEFQAAYLSTNIRIEVAPGIWLPIESALDVVPASFHVITAWNPWSEELPKTQNDERMENLLSDLDDLFAITFRAVGSSADDSWSEESFAVWGIDRATAIELGAKYEQHAIFEIEDEELTVLGCDGTWSATRRLDIVAVNHEKDPDDSGADLPTAIERALGFTPTSGLKRAAYHGWVLEPGLGAPCPTCELNLELFGCTSRARDGETYRLMAFACGNCRRLLWPHDVNAAVRSAAKAIRAFRAAELDARDRKKKEAYHVYVIQLEGVPSDRPTGSRQSLPWVYVGQSARTPEVRFQQHLDGYKASRWARRYGSHLRPDLYEPHPDLPTKWCALTYEAWLAASLTAKGYPVKGGH